MRSFNLSSISTLGLLLACGIISGCANNGADQPDTGDVSGVVMLDGNAVANAQVTFIPEGGRPSSGITDTEGAYRLVYNTTTMGAKVGKHRVSISTAAISEDEKPKELLPEVVASGSALTAEVKGGTNTIDFKLESKDY